MGGVGTETDGEIPQLGEETGVCAFKGSLQRGSGQLYQINACFFNFPVVLSVQDLEISAGQRVIPALDGRQGVKNTCVLSHAQYLLGRPG